MSPAPPQAEQPAQRAGSVWDYVTPARLNLWLKCPLAFQLRYLDGVKMPPTPNLFLGQRVHHGLEMWYRRRQLQIDVTPQEVIEQIGASWQAAVAAEGVQFTSVEQESQLKGKATGLVETYLAGLADEPRPLAVETSVEVPLVDPDTGEDLGLPLVGVLDLVLPGEGGALIADFKTASSSSAPLEQTHEVQLSCYSLLYRAATGQREAGLEIRSLVKTKKTQVERHPYAPRERRHFRRLFAITRAYLDDLDRQRFVYRPGWSCSMCEYRERHCCNWEP